MEYINCNGHNVIVSGRGGISFIFGKKSSVVLANEPGLTTIAGFPCKQGKRKRYPVTPEELAHQKKYGGYDRTDTIWYSYQVDWSSPPEGAKTISDTDLVEVTYVSSNSLSDASIYVVAIQPKVGAVSICVTSYWVEDKHDVPRWERRLREKYSLAPIE